MINDILPKMHGRFNIQITINVAHIRKCSKEQNWISVDREKKIDKI